MNLSQPPINCDHERVDRVTKAVLRAEFFEAAEAYAEALHQSEQDGDLIRSLRPLMAKRERFTNLYLMLRDAS